MNSTKSRPYLLLIATFIWGFAFVAQSNASEYLHPFSLNGIRYFIGALSIIPVIIIFERGREYKQEVKKCTIKYGTITGVMLFLGSFFQQWGIMELTKTNNATKVGFITGLYTVLVPILGIFLGKKTRINVWIAAFMAATGLYLISIAGNSEIALGDIVSFGGTIFWSCHILCIDKFVGKVNPIRFSFVQFVTASVLSIISAFVLEGQYISDSIRLISNATFMEAWIPILYAGIMSSGVAFTLQVLGQQNLSPAKSAILLSTESLFSALGFALLHHEVLTVHGYIGCAVIFGGILVSQLNLKSKY